MRESLREGNFDYNEFITLEEREALYKFFRSLTEFLEREKVSNIIFLDRASRPAWVGVNEFWNQNFQKKDKPGMYFLNPDGFDISAIVESEIASDPGNIYMSEIGYGKDLLLEKIKTGEITQQIVHRFEEVFSKLAKQKGETLVIFDTCTHTGKTIKNVSDFLQNLGFTDVRIIAATPSKEHTCEVKSTDLRERPMYSCYPFGNSSRSLVEKTNDIVSSRDHQYDRSRGINTRQEIKRIIQTKGKE